MNEADGQLHTLSVLEQLREASKGLWGASSEAYFRVDELLRELANSNLHDIPRNLPFRVENLHDIPRNLPFRVEMWDQSDQRAVRCSLGNLRIKRRCEAPPPFASGGGLVVFRSWRLRLRTNGTHRIAVTRQTVARTPIGQSE